jgi:hypothetical protein
VWKQILLAIRFHASVLLALLDPEYGGDISVRNVGWLSTDYTALYHNHRCENLKSYNIIFTLRVFFLILILDKLRYQIWRFFPELADHSGLAV